MAELVRRRLLHGFGANALGSVVTTLIQLVAVPILIQSWGARLYGEWLVLIAIPTFISMSDWGFENVAGTEMILALTDEDRERAAEIYRTLQLFVAAASICIVVIAAGALRFLPVAKWLVPGGLDARVVSIIIVVLIIHVGVVVQGGLIRAVFRSGGDYALGVMYQNFTRVGDAAAVIITAMAGGGLIAASLAMLSSRATMTAIAHWQMRTRNRWIQTAGRPSRRRLRELAPAIVAMMAFPLGFALSLQGMVTIIGLILGPIAVVTFATTRTLSRFVFQLGGVISNATWPELSFAFGNGDLTLARALNRRGFQAVAWLTLTLAIVMGVMGALLLRWWTRGAVQFHPLMLGVLLLVAVIDACWTASSVAALAAGRYRGISVMYVVTTSTSLIMTAAGLRSLGIEAAPVALLIGSVVMFPYVFRTSLELTHDRTADFLQFVVRPPAPRAFLTKRVAEPAQAMPS
jgi:O-antigen/teichoic acid export membrane protein